MELKLADARRLYQSILKIQEEKMAMGVKERYAFAKNRRLLEPEVETYDKARNELLQEFGHSTDGKEYMIMPDKVQAFQAAIRELDGMMINVDLWQLRLSALDAFDPAQIDGIFEIILDDMEDPRA